MAASTLRADCARCAALCCVALAFDKSELFAFDKPAGEPCPHLTACGGCGIHADLAQRGFRGCVAYDCAGAGQYVTQVLFEGRSWRDDPALLGPMMEAFSVMQQVQAQRVLLRQAAGLPLSPEARRTLERLERSLRPLPEWTAKDVAAFRITEIVQEVRAFLATLRPFVSAASPSALPAPRYGRARR